MEKINPVGYLPRWILCFIFNLLFNEIIVRGEFSNVVSYLHFYPTG